MSGGGIEFTPSMRREGRDTKVLRKTAEPTLHAHGMAFESSLYMQQLQLGGSLRQAAWKFVGPKSVTPSRFGSSRYSPWMR